MQIHSDCDYYFLLVYFITSPSDMSRQFLTSRILSLVTESHQFKSFQKYFSTYFLALPWFTTKYGVYMYCVYMYVHIYTHFRKFNLRYVNFHSSFLWWRAKAFPLCVSGICWWEFFGFLLAWTYLHYTSSMVSSSNFFKVEQALKIFS